MKYILLFLAVMAVGACGLFAETKEELPPAARLLEDMRAQLPREPVVINGDLEVRRRKGIVTQTLKVEISMDLGKDPASAKYVLADAFGRALEQMIVIRKAGQPARFEYSTGSPLAPAALPDLFKPLQETDVSWMDLTLSFLWWTGGQTLRTETLRGQNCFVVDVQAPADEKGQYATVRLWLDEKLHMILQAEGYDAAGQIVRRLFIKSFKKVDDRWMIKDMDMQGLPSDHRTNLRVETMHVAPAGK